MTQAPTPGPLSAAIDMLSEARDFIDRFSDLKDGDYGTSEPNAAMVMVHEINATIDHLSAPTDPVEARGSEREAVTHEVKCWREPFAAVKSGAKPWELRLNDRDYRVGDTLRQFEWNEAENCYTGDEVSHRIGWALHGPAFGLPEGYVIMTLEALRPQPSGETREAVARIVELAVVRHGVEETELEGTLLDADAILALIRPAPVASGGQHGSGEDAAWTWLNGHVECDPADRDYSADEMVDAFMAGAGRYDLWVKALERIAGEHQHRSGYCQTDITVEPALTAEEAQTVARDALSGNPALSKVPVAETAGEAVDYDLPITDYTPSVSGLSDYLWNQEQAAESIEDRCIFEQWREAIDALKATKLVAINPEQWTPCSPEWLDVHPRGCSEAPRVAAETWDGHSHYHPVNWPVPAQDDDKLRIPAKWFEVAEYATERGLAVHESNIRLEEFRRVVSPEALATLKSEGK